LFWSLEAMGLPASAIVVLFLVSRLTSLLLPACWRYYYSQPVRMAADCGYQLNWNLNKIHRFFKLLQFIKSTNIYCIVLMITCLLLIKPITKRYEFNCVKYHCQKKKEKKKKRKIERKKKKNTSIWKLTSISF
jgi:hypothetical protein